MMLSKKNWTLLILSSLIIVGLSCKKTPTEPDDSEPTSEPPCEVKQDNLVVNSEGATIMMDTTYVNGDTLFTAELEVSQGNGITLRLSSKTAPVAGDYSITNNILELKEYESKAFAQLFINGTAYLAQSGKVTVFNNGGQLRAKACGIKVDNPVGSDQSVDFNANLE